MLDSKSTEKVQIFVFEVREYQAQGEKKGMCTARPGWQTISPQNMNYKTRMYPIKVNLVDILEIDTERRTVRCEPLVSMGQLTSTLDSLGWTIPIVPELVMNYHSLVREISHILISHRTT